MNQKILFIRVTENCNANCFMCNFAGNKNGHIMSICEMSELIKELEKYDFKLIKFTGGEPLTNPYLKDFIKMLKNKIYYTSIITNGFLLPKKIDELANAGLDQIIVSIDGIDKSSNDVLGVGTCPFSRNSNSSFIKAYLIALPPTSNTKYSITFL